MFGIGQDKATGRLISEIGIDLQNPRNVLGLVQ